MARKSKGKRKGKSTRYYRKNRRSLMVKRRYQKRYNKKKKEVKRRVQLNRINRRNHRKGRSRVGDGKDVSHTKKGRTTLEIARKNRARNRSRK